MMEKRAKEQRSKMDQFGPIGEIENLDQTEAPKDNFSTQSDSR